MIQRLKLMSIVSPPQQTQLFSYLTIAKQALLSRAITYILIYGDTFILFLFTESGVKSLPF